MVELKNDLAVSGTLHSVDQYLNVKLLNTKVINEQKYPHMVRVLTKLPPWHIVAAPPCYMVNTFEALTRSVTMPYSSSACGGSSFGKLALAHSVPAVRQAA